VARGTAPGRRNGRRATCTCVDGLMRDVVGRMAFLPTAHVRRVFASGASSAVTSAGVGDASGGTDDRRSMALLRGAYRHAPRHRAISDKLAASLHCALEHRAMRADGGDEQRTCIGIKTASWRAWILMAHRCCCFFAPLRYLLRCTSRARGCACMFCRVCTAHLSGIMYDVNNSYDRKENACGAP